MIAMLSATYPGHMSKQLIQAYMSPEFPKRPESIKELSSINYSDESGFHSVFMFDVPDTQVAEFITVQNMRNVFAATRVPGLTGTVRLGTSVSAEEIKRVLSMAA